MIGVVRLELTAPPSRLCPAFAAALCVQILKQVGGLGLTLTAADRVVIVDPSWNPAQVGVPGGVCVCVCVCWCRGDGSLDATVCVGACLWQPG
jgi:hypothetical protein